MRASRFEGLEPESRTGRTARGPPSRDLPGCDDGIALLDLLEALPGARREVFILTRPLAPRVRLTKKAVRDGLRVLPGLPRARA